MNKLELLFESSSLRDDLLNDIKEIITDLINNINLDDEVVARINDKTYEFLKEIKQV